MKDPPIVQLQDYRQQYMATEDVVHPRIHRVTYAQREVYPAHYLLLQSPVAVSFPRLPVHVAQTSGVPEVQVAQFLPVQAGM